jgi:DNA primase
VYLKHGGFHCFGCGEKGDLITFHAKLNRLSFPEAIEDLARRFLL